MSDPVVIDPALSGVDGSSRNDEENSSYFSGGAMRKDSLGPVPDSATSSTFSRYSVNASPKDDLRHHPYHPSSRRTHNSGLGPDGKPVFSMPFSQSTGTLLAPIETDADKEASSDSADLNTWPRW